MTIGIPHQLYKGGLQARDIYPELKRYFYKENSDVTWEEFLTIKFALWTDTCSSTDNTLHGSSMIVNKGVKHQIKKASEASDGDLMCYVFSFEDALAHIGAANPSIILSIEK